ncbi:MAG: thermonuclease family protein [Candidatus Electrothrix aestuarii]|uniref:Thermonuclease family protein n=1 Tax=Candidatus Electrothrix aestuarii TaxID=3062594 RepID=A0AAU8LRW9_9BACT|nr:thermonuclease family protein [Candidatus Electrothrix aestuarii]
MFRKHFVWFFILFFLVASNVHAKNCKKGKPCGNSCIARSKTCHKGSGSSSSSSSSSSYSSPSYSSPSYSSPSYSSPSYSSPRSKKRKTTKRKTTGRYAPTASYTSPRRSFPVDNFDEEETEKKPVTIRSRVSMIDDSDIFETNNKKCKKIVLYGIDAPEEDQPFGHEAKDFLSKKIFKKKIKAKVYDQKEDGTNIALVFAGGKNINELMIKSGYAWVYQPSCDESFCDEWVKYEEEAREQEKGLWGKPGRIPPWIWR